MLVFHYEVSKLKKRFGIIIFSESASRNISFNCQSNSTIPAPLHLHAMLFPLRYTSLTIIWGKRHRLPAVSVIYRGGCPPSRAYQGFSGLRFDSLAKKSLSRKCFMGPLHATKCLHFGHIPAAVVNSGPKRQKDMLFWWTFSQTRKYPH